MDRQNIICLVVDGLRSSALGAYGAAWCETPALDRLASESFLFDHGLVERPRLAPLYRAYWQGLHGMAPDARGFNQPTLPAILAQKGMTTALLTDEPQVAEHPLAADFGERIRIGQSDKPRSARRVDETQLARSFAAGLDWLDQRQTGGADTPLLLWLHCRGLAGPWDAPLEFRNSLADEEDPTPPSLVEVPCQMLPEDYDPDELLGIAQAYAGQVIALDECIGAWMDQLQASAWADHTLLVLLGARGFPLGEHRRIGYFDESLYGEMLHVPWMMRFPDGLGALARTQALAGPSDLPATLCDWLGIGSSGLTEDGVSLMSVVRGETQSVRDRIIMASGEGERAIRTPAWHLRRPPPPAQAELFVKPDDRWEANEISNRCPEVVDSLTGAIADFERQVQSGPIGTLTPLGEAHLTGSE